MRQIQFSICMAKSIIQVTHSHNPPYFLS
uniref:Uncharacterized protein n=1 Tax=Arundo donax TaxID=35708 RepID=A0A0A9HGU3_ARUDO